MYFLQVMPNKVCLRGYNQVSGIPEQILYNMRKDDYTGLEIAVIGMALKFPGANNPEEFWENLKSGKENIKFFSEEELDALKVDAATRRKPAFVNSGGGMIDNKEYFDADFFGYTPEEAILMDPQTRLFHEVTWQALEDSGYAVDNYDGRIGLYAGSSNSFHWEALTELSGSSQEMGRFAAMQLSSKDFLTSKISYKLNLKGPSVPVQTACSTSLVAIHLASRSLLLGECDIALAGGVTLTPHTQNGYIHQEGMILSKDGHCRSFDADATGTNAANGAGVVVLKSLKKAIADNDHVYAVIKGSAINNDGDRKTGYTAPSVKGQVEVIRSAINFARVDANTIQYIECHGTGTTLGDPIELEALSQAYQGFSSHACAIGCVKSNMGHLDSAAGVAGFIKTVLSLKNKVLVPSINFEKPNPKFSWDKSPFYVSTELKTWDIHNDKRRAAVSAFGIGGTNAHMILEEAPEIAETPCTNNRYELIVTSAKSKLSLEVNAQKLYDFINNENPSKIQDIAYTQLIGKKRFPYRRFIIAKTSVPLALTVSSPDCKTFHDQTTDPNIIFLFPGGGAQYVNMGKDLYEQLPYYKAVVDEGLKHLESLSQLSYRNYLMSTTNTGKDALEDTEIALPLLFIVEYALAKQLEYWELAPKAMIGHSLGEYVAACLAGVFTYENALKIVLTRGRLMKKVEEGLMLSVSASLQEIEPFLHKGISISAENGPTNCVLGSTRENILKAKETLDEKGIEAKIVNIAVASHSSMMEPVLNEFRAELQKVSFNKPQVNYISNVTGSWIGSETVDAEYWVDHLRNTVKFSHGIEEVLSKYDNCVFVEVGPSNILSNIVKAYAGDNTFKTVSLLRHPSEAVDDDLYMVSKLGELWLYGCDMNWSRFFDKDRRRVSLPTYHFDQKRYWIDRDLGELASSQNDQLVKNPDKEGWFYLPTWKRGQSNTSKTLETETIYLLIGELGTPMENIVHELLNRNVKAITVISGSEYACLAENSYTVCDGQPDDFESLFTDLGSKEIQPRKIVFISSDVKYDGVLNYSSIYQGQSYGFYKLVGLVKALLNTGYTEKLEIDVITHGLHKVLGSEQPNIAYATLVGVLKSITQEIPGFACRNIDVISPDILDASWACEVQLVNEIMSPLEDSVVALRNNKRWLPHYEPLKLKDAMVNSFKANGTYLITGGLGRIGFTLIEHLARVYKPNLIITGKTELPESGSWDDEYSDEDKNKIDKLRLLSSYGATVLYRSVDICDEQGMKELVDECLERFSGIDGIIHSTAVTNLDGFQTISELTSEVSEAHFYSKIYGLVNLSAVLEGVDYDFCLLMSSISSTLGGLGFGPYAAANTFMDLFAEYAASSTGKQWLSVGWDGWEYWEDRDKPALEESEGAFKMSLDEGPLAVVDIVNSGATGAVVHSLADLYKRIDKWIKFNNQESVDAIEPATSTYSRPELLTSYMAPVTECQKTLIEIWCKFFRYDKVGINDNFFDLGGNSLKGISLISIIQKKLNVRIPVKEFFTRGTVARLAEYISGCATEDYSGIAKADQKEYYPLSSAQLRLYLVQEAGKGSLAYNETYAFQLEGKIDGKRLDRAFTEVIDKHEIFRTKIVTVNGEPKQQILNKVDFKLHVMLSGEENVKAKIVEFIEPFDLNNPPYLRAALINIGEGRHILVIDMHHIITDGISANLLIRELVRVYSGTSIETPALQYKDYAEWQQSTRNSETFLAQRQFWLDNLAGEIPQLTLPYDHKRPALKSHEGDILHFSLPGHAIDRLYKIAQDNDTTMYVVLLTIYNIFLSRLSNQKDVIIGTPTSGRSATELENMMGMFVNTVVLRNQVDHQLSFYDMLSKVKNTTLQAFDNQDYQYEQLIEDLKLVRDPGRNPLFDVVFTFQNMESDDFKVTDLSFKPFDHSNLSAKFDLILAVTEKDKRLRFSFNYSTHLFKLSTIRQFASYFEKIIEQVAMHPDHTLRTIEILSDENKQELLSSLNNFDALYPQQETILSKFEEQVNKYPDAIALKFEDKTVTYAELDKKATQIAWALQNKGVHPESLVSVYLEPSLEVIYSIIGIVKAGCGYVPIDVHYPADRIEYILKDSRSSILLTSTGCRENIEPDCPVLLVDNEEIYEANISAFKAPFVSPDQLLYIIYTSGTTGKPKGVMIEHRNVIRLLFNSHFQFDFTHTDIWTLYHSHAFDFSVWEMYGALLYGAKLVIVPRLVAKDSAAFVQLVAQEDVTVLNQTPTAFYNFIQEALSITERLKLKYVIFGGEALIPAKLFSWAGSYPEVKLINMYGITETTVHVTYKEITCKEIESNVSNIGKPIPTLTTYILDENLRLQPKGVPGELCVGGAGVARGYLNRPELTTARFVDNPFKPGEKIYRSGDLARLLDNGEMEYLGRIDLQVKIRGYRIELGEVEYQVMSMDKITDAVVLAVENDRGEKSLCAYYVAEESIEATSLRSFLQTKLPDYMVPAYLIQVSKIPMTVHGKVDRASLPKPTHSNAKQKIVAPRNEVQRQLAEIWKTTLELDNVSIEHNFFHLGGDSIKAIRLVNNINKHFKSTIQLPDLYVNETIEKLCLRIKEDSAGEEVIERQVALSEFEQIKAQVIGQNTDSDNIEDVYPMSEIERGMVFNYMKNLGSGVYHDQFLFNLAFEDFNYDVFARALHLLAVKHQILRAGFNINDYDQFVQIVYKKISLPLELYDYSDLKKNEYKALIANILSDDIKDVFTDKHYPLWRMKLIKYGKREYTLLFIFHHAILDGWSVASLMTELNNTYYKLLKEPGFIPAPLKTSYKEVAITEYIERSKGEKLQFWVNELAGYERLELSFLPGYDKKGDMMIYKQRLGRDFLSEVNKAAVMLNTSVKNLFYSAYVYTLKVFSGTGDIISGWVTNNRPLVEDGDKILGCFLNTIPIRIHIPDNITYHEYVSLIDRKIREVKAYESVPLFEIAKAIGEKSKDRNPIFDTLFNFVNFHVYDQIKPGESGSQTDDSFSDGNQNTNTLFDFEISTTGNELYLLPKYDTSLISGEFVEKFCLYYLNILNKLLNAPEERMSITGIIPEAERVRLVDEFNDTTSDYNRHLTMNQLFEAQVLQNPDHPAISYKGQEISYQDFNRLSNQLAHALKDNGVGPGVLIGISMERSAEMVIAMMAIIKAGGAYVPMELNIPNARIIRIVNDLGLESIITSQAMISRLEEIAGSVNSLKYVYCLNESEQLESVVFQNKEIRFFNKEYHKSYPVHNPTQEATSSDTAYIIFTSGSTGTPKGVVVEHRPVINIIEWINNTFEVSKDDKLLFVTSIGFDLSVYDVFGVLGAGATIRLMDYSELADPKGMLEIIARENITIWDSAPAAIQLLVPLLDHNRETLAGSHLRLVMLSGDWIPVTLPDVLRSIFKNAEVVSLGGATEATIWSNYFRIREVDPQWKSIPYGKPIQNARYYILSEDMQVCPVGVPGDLYIGGECLSAGYVNDLKLTAQKFIRNPFCDGEVIYKTGDSARWFEDGNMEFLGRKDGQVKIRGFRIEVGEIESLLVKHDHVQNVVVLAHANENKEKSLCAYLVMKDTDREISELALRNYLQESVPDYFVPEHFIFLDEIPVTANGKVDRKLLPKPEVSSNSEYVEPSNNIEEKLAAIWKDILQVNTPVSTIADFFDLGGHSLNVTVLISQIQKQFSVEISIREIFSHTTIKSQADLISMIAPELVDNDSVSEDRENIII